MLAAIRQWVIQTMMKGQTGVVRTLPKQEIIELNVKFEFFFECIDTMVRIMENNEGKELVNIPNNNLFPPEQYLSKKNTTNKISKKYQQSIFFNIWADLIGSFHHRRNTFGRT